jgi:CBS domain-containing protein
MTQQPVHRRLIDASTRVGALMGPLLVSAQADLSIAAAAASMASHGIRHLPICDGRHKLVGMVSDRDVRLAGFREPGQADAAVIYPDAPVSQIMSRDVQTVAPDTTAAVAARRMLERRIGSLVVVSEGRPVGILSTRDLLKIVAAAGEGAARGSAHHQPTNGARPSAG